MAETKQNKGNKKQKEKSSWAPGKWFWISLVIGLLLAAGTVWAIFRVLDVYTRHGQSITVPDVTSMTLEEVERRLADHDLRFEIMDSTYIADRKPLEVLSQDPVAGSKVKENRKIYLRVNAQTPPAVKVPNVEGKSLNSALRILENRGLKVGRTIYQPNPYANSVIRLQRSGQYLAPETEIPQGSSVNLIVGSGLGESKVSVPSVLGMTLDEAEFVLSGAYNLTVGFVRYNENIISRRDSMNAVVYKQVPEPTDEEVLRWGESIGLYLMRPSEYEVFKDSIEAVNELQNPQDSLRNDRDVESP